MAKKKEQKPPKPEKTKEERESEVKSMKNKIEELGLSTELPGIAELYQALNDFLENGISHSGKTKIPEYNREVHYILTKSKNKQSTLSLLHKKY